MKKMTLFEAVKDLMEFANEDPEVTKALQSLKRDIAKDYVARLKEKNPAFFLMISEDIVVDYLLDEGILDQIHDTFVGKILEIMPWFARELKEVKEWLKSASTQEELARLKYKIWLESTSAENQESADNVSQWNHDFENWDRKESEEKLRSSQSGSFNKHWVWSFASFAEKKENLWKVEGFDATKFLSDPARKNPQTWVTLCAATAKFNAQKFGLTFPSGNAWDASTSKPIEQEYRASLPAFKKEERPNSTWEPLSIADFDAMKDVNVADIYPDSKSKYGHRAVAFRDQTGEWMVLDPYIKVPWTDATEPKKLEDYMKVRKVFKGHFYAV